MGKTSTNYLKKAMEFREMIDVLMDDKTFADIVLYNGNIVNVLSREIYRGDIAIKGERILLVGDCKDLIGENTMVIDMEGKHMSPGFIDSHMHFESSMLTITEFSRLSIPSGTATLVADPHEIGNSLGVIGMKAMADEINYVPNDVHMVVPSLVPDSPTLETAAVDISSKDMEDLLNHNNIIGIGELQGFSNVQHVYNNTPEVITDLLASTMYARSNNMVVDGNAPELFGKDLAAHIISTGGDCSCHETTTKEEAMDKIRQGVYVFMREGSTQKNMGECIRAVTEEGMDSRRCILATDDMIASDLQNFHMNEIIRRTIKEGIEPVEAIQMATINPATYFGFDEVGVLAPGKKANIAIIGDINEMTVDGVFLNGKLVASNNELLIDLPKYTYPDEVKHSVKIKPIKEEDLYIKANGNTARVRAIIAIPDQNLTGNAEATVNVQNGITQADPSSDNLLMACVERYGRTDGNIGKSFVQGFGLKEGAFAESVAHDTHNIMVVGTNYRDMMEAVNRVIELGGGIAVTNKGRILSDMRLGVGGLISDELTGHELSEKLIEIENIISNDLGCEIHGPLMHLSFLALSTSPTWKLTDRGIVDVNNFTVLPPVIE